MGASSITQTAGRDWWIQRTGPSGRQRYPERIRVGTLDAPRVYAPQRTCRMEYDTVHHDYVCTKCGERYDSGTYTSVSDDDKYLLKPIRFCANCGARVVNDDAG